MHRLLFTMGCWPRILRLRQMPAAVGKKSTVEQRHIRRLVECLVTSLKRIRPMEPDMDQLCRSICTTKHTTCSRKAQKKQCSTFLERWYEDGFYLGSLSKLGWNEENIMEYDKIALEDHSCTATSEERRRNENSWKLSLNAGCTWTTGSARRLERCKRDMRKTVP